MNFVGMVYYSYQAVNAPKHQLLYLFMGIWSTYCCWYMHNLFKDIYAKAKEIVDRSEK